MHSERPFSYIFDRLMLVGGPARSGTTLLAKLLNEHPEVVTAIDTGSYECWAIYYYLLEVGLVQDLREGLLTTQDVEQRLAAHLIRNDSVCGIAPSDSVMDYPFADPPVIPMPVSDVPWYMDYHKLVEPRKPRRRLSVEQIIRRLPEIVLRGIQSPTWFVKRAKAFINPPPPKPSPKPAPPPEKRVDELRRCVPLSTFRSKWRLALKSPEITFVLPQLAETLANAQFVMVHRPVIEIAESMYRMASRWVLLSYHRRWQHITDSTGRRVLPQGIPAEWDDLWQQCTDFQMDVLHAASYVRAMALNIPQIPSERVFVYDHTALRTDPVSILRPMAKFLKVDPAGFDAAAQLVKDRVPSIDPQLQAEYDAIAGQIDVERWMAQVSELNSV